MSALRGAMGMCPSCRRLAQNAIQGAQQPVRGLKKLSKATSITVKLQENLPRFGKAGSIVPVPFGLMRNSLFPKGIAEYISPQELRQLRANGVDIERDYLYGLVDKKPQVAAPKKVARDRIDLRRLHPTEAYQLLDQVVPPTIDFYRMPIEANEARQETADLEPAQKEATEAAPPPGLSPRQTPDNIYGSVSTEDVEATIRALINQGGVTGLVILPDQEITFVNLAETGTDAKRIKRLGEFDIDIHIRGHDEAMKRVVRVLPGDDATVESAAPGGASVTIDTPPADSVLTGAPA